MTRFAIVQVGEQFAAIRRVAARIRGGTISAVVESNASQAERFARELGAETWTTSTADLHQHFGDRFDAWVVMTPCGTLVARHNDRPIDAQPESWSDLPDGWLWGNSHRFLPSIRTLKDSVDSGKLGATGLIRIHHWQSQQAHLKYSLLAQLDVACSLVDRSPTVVFALPHQAPGKQLEKGYIQVHVGFADDRMAVIDCTNKLPNGDDYYSASVISSTGAAYADDHHNMQLLFSGNHPQALKTSQGDRALLSVFQEFVDAANKSRPVTCGGPEWRRAQRLLIAIEQSLSTGQSQVVPGATG